MMGWGGACWRSCELAEVLDATLMMGWGWGMLTFVWTCWRSWCYADDGLGWGGVGRGMLTFVWTCWGSRCYADDGVGVGHVNVRVNLLRFLMLRWWWGGVGWGSWCYKTLAKATVSKLQEMKNWGCGQLSMPELVWSKNCVSPGRNTHLFQKPPNSDVWISEFL